MLNCRVDGRRRHGRPCERLLDEGETGPYVPWLTPLFYSLMMAL